MKVKLDMQSFTEADNRETMRIPLLHPKKILQHLSPDPTMASRDSVYTPKSDPANHTARPPCKTTLLS